MSKKLTTEEFINKAKTIHGDKYNYSLVKYENSKEKIKIICPEHGIFDQIPSGHMYGYGCIRCKNINISNKLSGKISDFIKKSNIKHNNKYDYSKSIYFNDKTVLIIICPIHGKFEQTPNNHLTGKGCKECGISKTTKTKILGDEKFIAKAILKHENKYDYSLVNYINNKNKVKIICTTHGEFEQCPKHHLKGQGCPICKESKGEREIRKYLNDNNINFISQKRFKECRNILPLPFDFYLPDYNICIEYDGEQHFKKFRFEKTNENLIARQNNDKIKKNFCDKNKISLLRISYNENILNLLKQSM